MDNNSKDAEVRARVPLDMFDALKRIADSRGEQLPVIAREAFAEYLAKRLSAGSPSEREAMMRVLSEKPEVAKALLDLTTAIREPVTYRKASKKDIRRKILDSAKREAEKHQPSPPRPK